MKKQNIPVAREGIPFIFLAAFATLIAAILQYECIAVIGFIMMSFTLYFFRDPERVIPEDPNALVSPADGKVIIVDKVFDDKFVKGHVYKVSIFMNIFNVHVNRVPFPGTVNEIKYEPGKFYAADSDKGALENEICAVIMEDSMNHKFAFVQMAGLVARRIVCWAEKGDSLKKGERFGLIRFGSRVDLYLPLNVQLEVTVGQKVKAGETIIGYLPN